ncbi:MAG: radical SAM protein [Methanobacteriales archaeon Met13]
MRVKLLEERCTNCNFCSLVLCPQKDVKNAIKSGNCMGCGACLQACPEEALEPDENLEYPFEELMVTVNDHPVRTRGLIKDALLKTGITIGNFPDQDNNQIFMPCGSGACWACSVQVNGRYALSCITPLSEGMDIQTLKNPPPLRVVSGFGAHTVGGVGTPYQLKNDNKPVEAVAFTHGCNLSCPQCQNYQMAFTAGGHLLDGQETALILLGLQNQYQVNSIAISGGESTLNQSWLLNVVKSIREVNGDVKIHLDTNGTLLTPDYIDDLVNAGVTEIGVDLKALHTATFMRITGLEDDDLARQYLQTSWEAVKYIIQNNRDHIFLGIGIPYHPELISKEELEEMGQRIVEIDPQIQVSLLDYRGEFRRMEMTKPSYEEMIEIKSILDTTGLQIVIAQTSEGHVGP